MRNTRTQWLTLALQNVPFLLCILVIIAFGILSPRFFTYKNFENIITQASYKRRLRPE